MRDPFFGTQAWQQLRAKVRAHWKRHGLPCAWCGQPFEPGEVLVVDHIKPRRKYPHLVLEPANLQCVHGGKKACNTRKHFYEEANDKPAIGLDGMPEGWR
jgi:5-methylcytosine-specific restriction endonuclease McrA